MSDAMVRCTNHPLPPAHKLRSSSHAGNTAMRPRIGRRRIVVLMEGSGSSFDSAPSNVTRTLESIALGPTSKDDFEQWAIWDHGVGTRLRNIDDKEIERAFKGIDRRYLKVLPPPQRPPLVLASLAKVAGLAFGAGLAANVTEAVEALVCLYEPLDELFLLGFSRGAFTVRVLAALLWRFGLPQPGTDVRRWVHERLAEMQCEPTFDPSRRFPVQTHFLGLWDTVKSYGFIRPVRFFHLRHNPGVFNVRHALALDEKRSSFQCTTWGGLDRDLNQRDGRRPCSPRAWKPEPNAQQTVKEVWFRGCHSDIGGGSRERQNAEITLRWMLREARDCGLVLKMEGDALVASPDPCRPITPTESWNWWWRRADRVPRWEISNDFSPARLHFAWHHTGSRQPGEMLRGGTVAFHETTGVRIDGSAGTLTSKITAPE
ncbi:Uncharacterized alpha/beta hydrolase domain [Rhodospirillales bacterium URHD0017]|nr:Uncharacterized alpha/beta hydrolase domain [Rhodospirillales bacterium URHD0017]